MKKTIIMVLIMVMMLMMSVPVLACDEEELATAVSEDMRSVAILVCCHTIEWTGKDGIINETWDYKALTDYVVDFDDDFTIEEVNEWLRNLIDDGAGVLVRNHKADEMSGALATIYIWEDGVDPEPDPTLWVE